MISVAIGTYNGARFIEKQLESIYNQTLPVDEVVICDDRSSDDTVNICQSFIEEHNLSNWNVYINKKNVGFCLNFYGAIERCNGEIIFLADQDDEWHKDKVEIMSGCLKNNSEITVLSSRYNVIDADSNIIDNSGVTYLGEKYDNSVEYLTVDSFVGCSYIRGFSICFKKEIKNYLKPIDLKSLLAHDWFICILGALTGKCAVLNTVLTDYRYHLDNVSLSDMTRKELIGDPNKRIRGLKESIEGHSYIEQMTSGADKEILSEFVSFEKQRLSFLARRSIFKWLSLLGGLKNYSRYYKGKSGIRVWLGDFAYAYNINFKLKK